MAGLNDLPNEIIIMMILLVLPDDLESFGNTSSTVHAVAKPYLSEHRKLKEQYFQTDCSGSGSQLFQLLNEVLMQPRLAFFVNEILLDGWSHIWQDRRPLSEMDKDERAIVHAPYNEEDMVRLRKAVADNVPQDEVADWIAAIEYGDEDPILALLVLILPKLTTLSLNKLGCTDARLFKTLSQVSGIGNQPPPASRLTKIRYQKKNAEYYNSLSALRPFAALPWVKSLSAWNIRDNDSGHNTYYEYWFSPLIPFNVVDLQFHSSSIGRKRFAQFVESFRGLESFTWSGLFLGRDEAASRSFDPFWVCAALLTHAKTLVSLTLVFHQTERSFIGDIRSFEVLKFLDTEVHLLLRERDFLEANSLAYLLPANIEKLCLRSMETDDDEILPLISGMARNKIWLPSLHEVTIVPSKAFKYGGIVNEQICQILEEQCKKEGIQLNIETKASCAGAKSSDDDLEKPSDAELTTNSSLTSNSKDNGSNSLNSDVKNPPSPPF